MSLNCSLTPFPEINLLLDRLLAEERAALGEGLVGLYLEGSLAAGDFEPCRSDIDFLAVTRADPSPETIRALEALHQRLARSGLKWAAKLEGAYLPLAALRRFDLAGPPRPTYNEGRFSLARHDSDWIIRRYVLREHGVAVAGPPIQPLIDPVPPDELRRAVRGTLAEWWQPLLADPRPFLRNAEYEDFAVLTMCRALHTLAHGDVASKPVAARWASAALGERWRLLIDRALAGRPEAAPSALAEVLAFIRYTLEISDEVSSL